MTDVRQIIDPILRDAGFELVEIQLGASKRRSVVRVFIDSENGISIDDCARMSEEISVHLDAHDPIRGSYVLEVSSPGLDRPLTKERDFRRAVGKKLHVILKEPCLGKTDLVGQLLQSAGELIVMKNGKGEQYEIPIDAIRQAKIRF